MLHWLKKKHKDNNIVTDKISDGDTNKLLLFALNLITVNVDFVACLILTRKLTTVYLKSRFSKFSFQII